MITPLISVVVCTFNRADILFDCLQTLCEQTLGKSFYEVIVVDNNSKDGTQQIVEGFIHHETNFSFVVETEQGLSHARNRGWHTAKGMYVAYTDDDCKLPRDWLAVAKEVIENVTPNVFGGPNFAFYNTFKPVWYKDVYSSTTLGNEARALEVQEHLIGNNIFFQRNVFEVLGGFNTHLGMTGNKIAYGEETEMVMRIRSAFVESQVYYEPRLFVYHLVRPEKMRLDWMALQSFASGQYSSKVFDAKTLDKSNLWRGFLREAVLVIKTSFFSIFWRDRILYPYWHNFFYEVVCQHLISLGGFYEQLQQHH